ALCAQALMLALVVMQAAQAAAPGRADSDGSTPVGSTQEGYREEELDEVLVEGHEPIRDIQVLRSWLVRLIGEFEVSGTLQFHQPENDSAFDAEGLAVCAGFQGRTAPAVHCDLNVGWSSLGDRQSAAG